MTSTIKMFAFDFPNNVRKSDNTSIDKAEQQLKHLHILGEGQTVQIVKEKQWQPLRS